MLEGRWGASNEPSLPPRIPCFPGFTAGSTRHYRGSANSSAQRLHFFCWNDGGNGAARHVSGAVGGRDLHSWHSIPVAPEHKTCTWSSAKAHLTLFLMDSKTCLNIFFLYEKATVCSLITPILILIEQLKFCQPFWNASVRVFYM